MEKFGKDLQPHRMKYRQLKTPLEVSAIVNRYTPPATVKEGAALSATTEKVVLLDSGALLIDMQQPLGRMAMLLLDPRSTSSAFRHPSRQTTMMPLAIASGVCFRWPRHSASIG